MLRARSEKSVSRIAHDGQRERNRLIGKGSENKRKTVRVRRGKQDEEATRREEADWKKDAESNCRHAELRKTQIIPAPNLLHLRDSQKTAFFR